MALTFRAEGGIVAVVLGARARRLHWNAYLVKSAIAMRQDFHPCTFAPPSVWLRLIWENGGVPRAYWGRVARILGLSMLAGPLRLAEYLRHSARVDRAPLEPPLFILGFARSGTTHLQNLVTRDARFGYLSTYQGAAAGFALVGRGRLREWMERGMAGAGEQTRPMDNVVINLSAPQEGVLAVANTSVTSFVHQLSFPAQTLRWFEKYVLMGTGPDGETTGNLSPEELARWERAYLRVVRKASLLADGKPLVLRNTVNTGRADRLLQLFPRAKFLHIVRNPYAVYPSWLHLYRTLLPLFQLDHYDWEEMEGWLTQMYARTMTKYLRDRERIPRGHLAEIRFEDLERDPLAELARAYDELNLPDFEVARPAVAAYLETVSGYQKNRLQMDQAQVDHVTRHWGFAAEAWGYDPPLATE